MRQSWISSVFTAERMALMSSTMRNEIVRTGRETSLIAPIYLTPQSIQLFLLRAMSSSESA